MSDSQQREDALDMEASPLVIAPAGSGKTSLLVARFLKSLLQVNQPESVLAITFTRKAAAEMRQRVVSELRKAEEGAPSFSEYECNLRNIACEVLNKSRHKGWGILENPSRLEIMTIDSFCGTLVKRGSLTSGLGGSVHVSANPELVFRSAAQELLEDYKEDVPWSCLVKDLVAHLGNRFELAKDMLVEMYASREQWLPMVLERERADCMREKLERNYLKMVNEILTPLLESLNEHETTLLDVAEFAVNNIPQSEQCGLANFVKGGRIPASLETKDELKAFIGLGRWMLRLSGTPAFRKSFNSKQGFPPLDSIKEKALKDKVKQLKASIVQVCGDLNNQDLSAQVSFWAGLDSVSYSADEWDVLEKLLQLLPIAVAKLSMVFKSKNTVDFTEISGAALESLGQLGHPTPLALRLDRQYQHILIDEFQDCNLTQLTLVQKLTSGWEPGDGRTLFMVGDPMQAIYLFRGGNVSLFLLVAEQGINHIKPKVLHLVQNFRSQGRIVEWVNKAFEPVFGSVNNKNLGLVAFNAAVSSRPPLELEPVRFNLFEDNGSGHHAEAICIVNKIHEIQQLEPDASIAILGRNRAELMPVIEQMEAFGLEHRAISIHKLKTEPVIMDLTAITRAIMHGADKVAWLALLRTPMIGLSMSEIHTIAHAGKRVVRSHDCLANRLRATIELELLDKNTLDRIKRLLRVMADAKRAINQGRYLHQVVHGTYIELGGNSLLKSQAQQRNMRTFLDMLSSFHGPHFDHTEFEICLNKLYAEGDVNSSNVQVMTIHKSKGLEFDYVFIPGAHKPLRSVTPKLIDSEQIYDTHYGALSVLAPASQVGLKNIQLNRGVRALTQMKLKGEIARLAYVAITRARKSVYVSGIDKGQHHRSDSILGLLKDAVQRSFVSNSANEHRAQDKGLRYGKLATIPSGNFPQGNLLAAYRGKSAIQNDTPPRFKDVALEQKSIESVVRATLLNLQSNWETACSFGTNNDKWRCQLLGHGVHPADVIRAVNEVRQRLEELRFRDGISWVLKNRPSSQTYKGICFWERGKLRTTYVDLTFVDNSVRYAIDCITGTPNLGESEEAFATRLMLNRAKKANVCSNFFDEKKIKYGLVLTALGKVVWYQNVLGLAA